MPKLGSLTQTNTFSATPHQLYSALMDSATHTKFSGDKAVIGTKVGDKFTTFGGWVHGKNLELVPDKKIVQTWHPDMEHWPADHDSIVTFEFAPAPGGKTTLTFTHTDIPQEHVDELRQGWEDNYWTPLRDLFSK